MCKTKKLQAHFFNLILHQNALIFGFVGVSQLLFCLDLHAVNIWWLTGARFCSSLVWLHQTRIGLSLYDVAGQGYLRESVRAELWFSEIKMFWNALKWQLLCFCEGSGELHPGADPHSASAGRTGEVLLLFLRLHCCSQVLFLPRPSPNRWVWTWPNHSY